MTDHTPPRTVADLVAVTGWDKDTVKAAIRSGELPGYHAKRPGATRGRYTIPGDAFEDFVHGRWTPIHHTVLRNDAASATTPVPMIHRRKAS